MTIILQWLITGLCVGLVYAMFCAGYSLMFGVMRCLNIAHAGQQHFPGGADIEEFALPQIDHVPQALAAGKLAGLYAAATRGAV